MGCLQQYQAKKIVEQATWTSSNNVKSWYSSKEVLLSVWWDYKGIVYFELLPPNRTINSVVYIEQLTKLNNAIEEKRPELTNRKGVVFHHDNARPHTSLVTRQKLLELGWDILPHPPYSLDLALFDWSFCFDLYKTPWMVKISIMMMISNRIWFNFLLIETRSFMNVGLWCCLKDGKRSLIKMGNTLQNKVI